MTYKIYYNLSQMNQVIYKFANFLKRVIYILKIYLSYKANGQLDLKQQKV